MTPKWIGFALGFVLPLGFDSLPSRAQIDEAAKQQGIVECATALVRKHNPGLGGPPDRLVCFQAYVSNFNTGSVGTERNTRRFGVPHWVSHHVERAEQAPETKDRPPSWFTVPDLQQQGIAPTDASYQFSQAFRKQNPNWFERGHLAQKYLSERLGGTAGWFTHNLANAVPQRSQFNKGAWLALECYTGAWANRYGDVWIVAGPLFSNRRPARWLRSDSNKKALPVAIPVGLFKIVARKSEDGKWEVLAFTYPQTHRSYRKGPFDPGTRMNKMAEIERLSGQRFFPSDDEVRTSPRLWSVADSDFDSGCKSFRTNVR